MLEAFGMFGDVECFGYVRICWICMDVWICWMLLAFFDIYGRSGLLNSLKILPRGVRSFCPPGIFVSDIVLTMFLTFIVRHFLDDF